MKNKLIIMRGLPGSGKSYWSAKYVNSNPQEQVCVISLDKIRYDIFNYNRGTYYNSFEPKILAAKERMASNCEYSLVKNALSSKIETVIIDDTNLKRKYILNWIKLAAQFNYEFEVHTMNTPVELCIENNSKREFPVDPDYILYKSQNAYWGEDWQIAEGEGEKEESKEKVYSNSDLALPRCIIIDIDGTLAQLGIDPDTNEARSPYDEDKAHLDTVTKRGEFIRKIASKYKEAGNSVFIFSGRREHSRQVSEAWLLNNGFIFDALVMRPDEDSRKDLFVKRDMFDNRIRNKFTIDAVFDDRNQCVDLWHNLGLPIFNCNPTRIEF